MRRTLFGLVVAAAAAAGAAGVVIAGQVPPSASDAQRPTFGQRGSFPMPQGRMRAEPANLEPGQLPYDGRFTYARLRFANVNTRGWFGGGRRGGSREPPWSHDYPRAERNFMKILESVTCIRPYDGPAGGIILDIGSPDLFKYPYAHMAEPGFWTQTDEEAANLRAYLLKGGFIVFDDFRAGDWGNFEMQMQRVLPEGRLVLLDVSNPIFHSFFDIETLDFVQYYGRDLQALFYGMFEDNDPQKRLLLIANYNNDIGEYWEFSDTGWTPIDLSNEAYKFGVNYVVYGLTH